MKKYRQKFLWRNIIYSNFVIILLALLVLGVCFSIFKMYGKYKYTKEEYSLIENEVKGMEKKLDVNQSKLDNINTEEGKEKYLRETYSIKKHGEDMIVVYNEAPSTYEIPKGESNWQTFKNFLKNLFVK